MSVQKNRKSSRLPAKTGLEGGPNPGADRALWVEQSNALLPDASPNNSFTNLINKYKKQYKVNSFEAKIILTNCLSPNSQSKIVIKRCDHPRCLTCPIFNINSCFQSSITGKQYKTTNPNICKPLDCKSNNIIYLITCKKCGYQYVGETTQEFSKRLNGHRKSVRLKSRLIGQHFSLPEHDWQDMRVQILEKIIPIQGKAHRLLMEECLVGRISGCGSWVRYGLMVSMTKLGGSVMFLRGLCLSIALCLFLIPLADIDAAMVIGRVMIILNINMLMHYTLINYTKKKMDFIEFEPLSTVSL